MSTDLKTRTLDPFCQLALESDLSDEQLAYYAGLCLEYTNGRGSKPASTVWTVNALVSAFRGMTAPEAFQAVQRAASGHATSTSNRYTEAAIKTMPIERACLSWNHGSARFAAVNRLIEAGLLERDKLDGSAVRTEVGIAAGLIDRAGK